MFVMQIALLFRPTDLFLSRPFIEDAYYSFSVSRSLALGHGFTIDGEQLTNGVQPLICLVNVPAFLTSPYDPVAPLKLILAVSILLWLATSILAGLLAVRLLRYSPFMDSVGSGEGPTCSRFIFWLTAASFYVNYTLSIQFLNGLETGMTMFLLLVALLVWLNLRESLSDGRIWSKRPYFLYGMLLGLLILARIDTLFFAIAIALSMVFEIVKGRGSTDQDRRNRMMRAAGTIGLTALGSICVVWPWFTFNLVRFGSLMPVSGQSQQDLSPNIGPALRETLDVYFDSLFPGFHTPVNWQIEQFAWPGLVIVLLGLLALGFRRIRSIARSTREVISSWWDLESTRPFVLFFIALSLFYTVAFRAPHFQSRYLLSVTVFAVLIRVIVMATVVMYRKSPAVRISFLGAFWVIMILSCTFFLRNYTGAEGNMMLATRDWITANLRDGEQVGIFQSGTLEYFFPRSVVNLDGKVNYDAYRAYRASRLYRYVDSMRLDYIIDWDQYVNRIEGIRDRSSSYTPIDTLGNAMVVWKRR